MTRPPFIARETFLGCDVLGQQRFAVAGVAYDGATTNRPGARFGPQAIRRASHMLCDGTHPHFDVAPAPRLGDAGDLGLPHTSLEAMRSALVRQAAPLIRNHHMVWLGGDHSITLPLLRAYREWLGRPLALIHFDAHCDTWSDHFGEHGGHGTWLHEALLEGLVLPRGVVQIGIRSSAEREARERVPRAGGMVFGGREMRGRHSAAELAQVIEPIRQRMDELQHPPLYVSLDIDCLDPAAAPGTGTPEPGGLTSAQALTLVEELCSLEPVGMDCVEVAPAYDHAELTSLAAAHLVWTYLCGRMAATD